MTTEHKYSISVDFDGVIHSYTSPWVASGVIPGPPVDGAIAWLDSMLDKFEVYVFSTRCRDLDGRVAMRKYLHDHGLTRADEIVFATDKPPALVYIDDRAWRFEGRFPSAHEIHSARPWNHA